jgi:hypothetical protein
MHLRDIVLGAAFSLIAAPTFADQAPVPPILRGTIAKIDATSISISKPDGTLTTVALAPDASYSVVVRRHFEDIKATDFIGVTSETGPDGKPRALEIHIFPTKGWNEGSYPWDHHPEGVKPSSPAEVTSGTVAAVRDEQPSAYTMTNAAVTQSSGMRLAVTYQGSTMVGGKCTGRASAATSKPCTGVASIEVPPWAPVMAIVPGTAADAKVGRAVFAGTTTKAPGKPMVTRLVLEKNGVKPMF